MFDAIASGVLDLLAPPRCPACDLTVESAREARFCDACAVLIELAPAGIAPPVQHAGAVLYQGPMADAIRRFKYANRSSLARDLSPWLVAAAGAYAGAIDAVLPMPLHPSKLRLRGWNPSALLARPVAKALAVPLHTNWLQRTRATATQAGLSRDARCRNVAGAFRTLPARAARVLLIDDVRTTGATLAEATRCLEARGHRVNTLALAWSDHDTLP